MRSNDIMSRDAIRANMQAAIQSNDTEAFYQSFDQMLTCIEESIKADYQGQLAAMQADSDARTLTARGVRQLTTREKDYYHKLADAMRAKDPKQAIANLDVVMPETVVDAVFDELQTSHPLLSRISFTPTGGAIKLLMNTNGYQEAAWGPLCDEIVKELLSGFKEVDTGLLKLSAFLPVCKAMLDLGPEWLDSYVRQVLYEALSNGLESGIIMGDGDNKPIGMIRDVSEGVSISGGKYPEKAAIDVTSLDAATVGKLLGLIAVDGNGKPRRVQDVLLIVNPQDYFQRVMPATTIMGPDGTYRSDVMPYPVSIIQSPALPVGKAVFGIGYKYFAAAGTATNGQIEYSDHYRFLEDERVYLIKAYCNGLPMDNNAFLNLDISGLQPTYLKVETVTPPAASTDAELSDLKIGALTLTPVFAGETTTYTASTTNATNTVTATPSDAGATIEITNKDTDGDTTNTVANGSAVTWFDGSNTLTVKVTAADGTTTKSYVVTVTKS